jgi:hypothetical protein
VTPTATLVAPAHGVTAKSGPGPTPSAATPVSSLPAMAAKSAIRLIGSATTQDPTMPGDPGGVSPQKPAVAERGLLPTTGADLGGLAAIAIGFAMAGGGGLLGSRRLRKRQRNG